MNSDGRTDRPTKWLIESPALDYKDFDMSGTSRSQPFPRLFYFTLMFYEPDFHFKLKSTYSVLRFWAPLGVVVERFQKEI